VADRDCDAYGALSVEAIRVYEFFIYPKRCYFCVVFHTCECYGFDLWQKNTKRTNRINHIFLYKRTDKLFYFMKICDPHRKILFFTINEIHMNLDRNSHKFCISL
jgi:hypothetical protein